MRPASDTLARRRLGAPAPAPVRFTPAARSFSTTRAVAVDREEPLHALGDHRADAVDRGELLDGRGRDAVEVAERARERLRGGRPDVVDAEARRARATAARCFDPSIASTRFCADFAAMRSSGSELVDGQRVDVAGVLEQAGVDELADALLAETLDVHRAAAREVHDALHALRRAVDVDAVVVGLALEPHERLSRTPGTSSGTSTRRAALAASASTGPTTSGITSPALRTITVSPGRTSLRATSSSLCSVASPTVEPPTNTGSSTANGVARPVRPMLTMMSRSSVVFSSGGNLYAIAQRGALLVKPISARWREVVDLHDHAVDLVAERVPLLLHAVAERGRPRRGRRAPRCAG